MLMIVMSTTILAVRAIVMMTQIRVVHAGYLIKENLPQPINGLYWPPIASFLQRQELVNE